LQAGLQLAILTDFLVTSRVAAKKVFLVASRIVTIFSNCKSGSNLQHLFFLVAK
jgi:hypothetical protein